jgi:Uma2 family endonuclease
MSTIASSEPLAVPVAPEDPGWVPSPLYRMSLEKYEAMVASGVFTKRDRFHLINGYLVEKMTQNPPHTIADDLCGQELARVLPGWYIRAAKPIRLPGQASEPEHDRCVVRGATRNYLGQHPGPSDIVLLVEVSDTSLATDREYGSRLYGPAGIPVYWIVNLVDRQVEVYTDPGPNGYATRTDYRPGQRVPVVIGGQPVGQVAVDDILP